MFKCWLIAIVALLAVACSERPVGAVAADTPRTEWSAEEVAELCYTNSDTLSHYNLAVVARWEAAHSGEVLPLRIEVQSPSGATFGGEVVLTPSDKHRGGSFVEFSAAWIEDARFVESGDYHFWIAPCQPARGVWSIGVRLDGAE